MARVANLSVGLTANSAQYRRGLDQAAMRTQSFRTRINRSLNGLSRNFNGITTAIGAVSAALGAQRLLSNADNLVKNADAAGINFEAYQRLQFGFEQAGISQSSFARSTARLSRAVLEGGRGSETYLRNFDAIGISFEELQQLSPEARLLAVSTALNNLESDADRQAISQELLGREFATVAVDIDAVVAAGAMLPVITEEAARSAEASNDAFNNLGTSLGNLTTNALIPLVDALTPVVQGFVDFAQQNPMITNIGIAVTAATVALGLLAPVLITAATAIGTIGAALLLNPIGLTITAIAAAVALGITAWNNWDTIVATVSNFFAPLSEGFGSIRDSVLGFLGPITRAVGAIRDLAIRFGLISDPAEALMNATDGAVRSIQNFSTQIRRTSQSSRVAIQEQFEAIGAGQTTVEQATSTINELMEGMAFTSTRAAEDFRENVLEQLEITEREAVGASIIPDMVDAIDDEMMQLPAIGMESGSGFRTELLSELEGTADDVAMTSDDIVSGLNDLSSSLGTIGQQGGFSFKANLTEEMRDTLTQVAEITPNLLGDTEELVENMAIVGEQAGTSFRDTFLAGLAQTQTGASNLVAGIQQRIAAGTQSTGSAVAQSFDTILSATASYSRDAFELNKSFQIASATIDTYRAFTSALANPPGPPFSYAIAAAALATGLAQVAAISSQQFQGLQTGGVVNSSGVFRVGEAGPENIFLPGGAMVAAAGSALGPNSGATTIGDVTIVNQVGPNISPRQVGDSTGRRFIDFVNNGALDSGSNSVARQRTAI